MATYLLKLLYLLMFSTIVIYVYYFWYTFHQVDFVWYTPYIISLLVIYTIYKIYNYLIWKKLSFSIVWLFLFFLLHLLVLSVFFFNTNASTLWDINSLNLWVKLFFNIFFNILLPIIIVFSSVSIWKKVLSYIKDFDKESSIFQFLSSLWIWFVLFVLSLYLFALVGLYNYYIVFSIILLFIAISYKESIFHLKSLYTYKIEIQDHDYSFKNIYDFINLRLLTTEFLFIIATFLIAVNFISITRPMPIGWDDMGVYMNYPQLMAQAWEVLNLWWSISWSLFTWIWYMFNSATQSFFLNNVWWVLAFLVIVLSFSDLLKTVKKTFINIPLLAWTIFLSMPMIIFQLAKDQKQDPGLFFISAIAIYLVLYIFLKYIWYKRTYKWENFEISQEIWSEWNSYEIKVENQEKDSIFSYFTSYKHIWSKDLFSNKSYLIYIFIIWVLAWFAFSIKVTSLLLISGIFWVLFYSKLWVAWFLAYILIYIWIFTKFWLWDMMNVVYPWDDITFINNVFIISILIWFSLLWYSFYKYWKKAFNGLLIISLMFLLWITSVLTPFFAKNISSLDGNITISWILSWKTDRFIPDYTKIYTLEELEEIQTKRWMTETWTTLNEDLGRYFGYEEGINNYLKLPYNLTMQTNQSGEYTDITYLYFALIPVIIIFLSYKYGILVFISILFSLFTASFFFISEFNTILTSVFSSINLPFWYLIIFLFFFIPTLFLLYWLDREKFSNLFKLNLIFAVFYIFLWSISAFWIVWYGIAMYYSLLLAIAIWIHYIVSYSDKDSDKEIFFRFFGSLVIIFIIFTYFFSSTIPSWFNNIKSSWYANFKSWITDKYTTIFSTHVHYFDVLSELNISRDKKEELMQDLLSWVWNNNLKNLIQDNNIKTIKDLDTLLIQINDLKIDWSNIEALSLKKDAKNLRYNLYKNVLYPKDDFINQDKIYRIWTFLKYFISQNNTRLLEDSLIFNFDDYFYDEKDIDIWIDRMKKIWLDYLLVDLNAATIDKDPRKDLTRRFENLLKTFTSNNVELIKTDSICLQTALDSYKWWIIELDDFIKLAWVNYENYDFDGNLKLHRREKQIDCYNHILILMSNDFINEDNFSYLIPIQKYINDNDLLNNQEAMLDFFSKYVSHWWFGLFRIK